MMIKQKEKVIERLRWLADGGEPMNVRWGICRELRNKFGVSLLDLEGYFTIWAHYSGNRVYPVPATDSVFSGNEADQYHCLANLWAGRQGELRRDLCRHIADRMEDEDENEI